jgi:hypothetical protein
MCVSPEIFPSVSTLRALVVVIVAFVLSWVSRSADAGSEGVLPDRRPNA